jgi:hypothetical protein
LYLDSGQAHPIIIISRHQVLVAIMPEQWMGLHLNQLILRSGRQSLRILLEVIQVVQLNWNDGARLWILNLKDSIEITEL